jgi:hypothetical protein
VTGIPEDELTARAIKHGPTVRVNESHLVPPSAPYMYVLNKAFVSFLRVSDGPSPPSSRYSSYGPLLGVEPAGTRDTPDAACDLTGAHFESSGSPLPGRLNSTANKKGLYHGSGCHLVPFAKQKAYT